MNILVTGAAGFFGVNVVRHLALVRREATLIATYASPPDAEVMRFLEPVSKQVRLLPLEVADRAAVVHLVGQERVTHIVHAAAITPPPERERQEPTRIVDVNLGGQINILEAMLRAPAVERCLLISSSGVYGAPDGDPLQPQSEDGPFHLNALYAICKHAGDVLGKRYAELTGRMIAAARFPAMFGPLERPTRSRQGMSMPQRVVEALESGHPIRVAGAGHTSDWTYILDAAEGVRALLDAPQWRHPVYNVSCGQARTFADLVAAFAAHGLNAAWVDDPAAADVAMYPAQVRAPMDITRLQVDTDFRPRYPLEAAVADLMRYRRAGAVEQMAWPWHKRETED